MAPPRPSEPAEGRYRRVRDKHLRHFPYLSFLKSDLQLSLEAAQRVARPAKNAPAARVAKLEELRRSERVEAMVEAFKEAREHPAEKVTELKSKAVDLIKYEKVTEYREYVCSEQFVSDTTKLVKEDLPQLAKDAAVKGQAAVQATATVLTAELDAAKTIVGDAWKKGYEKEYEIVEE